MECSREGIEEAEKFGLIIVFLLVLKKKNNNKTKNSNGKDDNDNFIRLLLKPCLVLEPKVKILGLLFNFSED